MGAPDPFRLDLRDRLCADFAAAPHFQPPEMTAQRADALWRQARDYGMRTQSDMTRYSYLMMGFWDGWADSPDRPWISVVLLRKDLSGTAKLDFIYDTLEQG